MLCGICQNKNEKQSVGNESSSFGNTTMSTKTNTQLPVPLPKEAVKATTCGGSPSLSVPDDVNTIDLLKKLPEMKVPESNIVQTTPTSIQFTNRTSPPVAVGDKGTPEPTTAQPGAHKEGKQETVASIVCKKRKQAPTGQRKKTTCRRSTKRGSSTRIGLKVRVKTQRQHLYHILITDSQRKSLSTEVGNTYNYYGRVVGGNSFKGWNVQYDLLPHNDNIIKGISRTKLSLVGPDEEEVDYDHSPPPDMVDGVLVNDDESSDEDEPNEPSINKTNDDMSSSTKSKRKKLSASKQSIKNFTSMDKIDIANADHFEYCYGTNKKIGKIDWKILPDTDYLEENDKIESIDEEKYPEIIKEVDWSDMNASFFEHIFPSIEGHGQMIDEYLSDPRAEYYQTVRASKIKFHDPNVDDDPDWKVKRCYTLLIAASSEVECGIENLWKCGTGNGRRDYPDFGRYVPRDAFKAFCSAAPYAYCHRRFWYVDKRDRPWDIFLPCLSSYNQKRRNLFKAILLLLDESMSGWRPKTSKLGGLPNISFEPRKPVPLGTMFKNGVECISGVFAYQDVVMGAEVQQRKSYFGDNSIVPGQQTIPSHTAEVMRQVDGANVPPNGWVGGDAWFGSVSSAIEVYKKFNVHSTFVIKNNTHLYPMEALHSVLTARFPKPVGHWVVFTTKIAGVDLFACAYAWSQSRVSYFISTTGNTLPSKDTYRTQFEDEFGCVSYKDIPRPVFADLLYDFLPLIDEHNKQHQNILNLERCWPTRNVWF